MTLPVGPNVPDRPCGPPEREPLAGRFIRLEPLDQARHAEGLFAISHGTPEGEAIWRYLAYGPFASPATMQDWLAEQAAKSDPLFFAVIDMPTDRPLGMVSFLNIVPDQRRLELGHIWYGPEAQRTKANTEAVYLMTVEAIDRLGYRRVEWKCDALNARSRAAALRLGFLYEGIFRQHMIVKGRNRDSAWFSLLDSEWPVRRANMERWLYGGETGLSLGKLNQMS